MSRPSLGDELPDIFLLLTAKVFVFLYFGPTGMPHSVQNIEI